MKVTMRELEEILHDKFVELHEGTLKSGTPEYDKAMTQYTNLKRLYDEAEKNLNKRAENRLKNKEINNQLIIEEMRMKNDTKRTIIGTIIPVVGSIGAIIISWFGCGKVPNPFYREKSKDLSNLAGRKF